MRCSNFRHYLVHDILLNIINLSITLTLALSLIMTAVECLLGFDTVFGLINMVGIASGLKEQ